MDNDSAIIALGALAQGTRLDVFRLLVRHEPDGMAAGEIARQDAFEADRAGFFAQRAVEQEEQRDGQAVGQHEDGGATEIGLSTLRGDLQIQGTGQWVGGRLRFRGEAWASPNREAALANLLNIIGRRQGSRSIINLG